MTATCLKMTGSRGPVIVEGPFARNAAYLDMLTTATGHANLQALTANFVGTPVDLLAHQREHHRDDIGQQIEQHGPVGAVVGGGKHHRHQGHQQPQVQLAARHRHAILRGLQHQQHGQPRTGKTPQRDKQHHRQQQADNQHHLLRLLAACADLTLLAPANPEGKGEQQRPQQRLETKGTVLDIEKGITDRGQGQRREQAHIHGEIGQCRRASGFHELNNLSRSAPALISRQMAPRSSKPAMASAVESS